MAAGDILQKRQGSGGIAYETTPGTAETAPVYYLPASSINIETDPETIERDNNIGAENIGMEQVGYNGSFSIDNTELDIETVGYLLWLILGNASTNVSTHAITCQFDSQYFTMFKDHGGIFDGTNRTQRAVKSRFDKITIDQQQKAFAKISASGLCCTVDEDPAALTPSLDLTDEGAPLSWNALRAGQFQINWNEAGLAAATVIKSLKIDIERELEYAGADLDSDQPDDIVQGGRTVMFEFTLDLRDQNTDAAAAYAAMKAGHKVGIVANWVIGSLSLTLSIDQAKITDNVPGELGGGAEPQEWTVKATAYQKSGEAGAIGVISSDGNATEYASR